MNAHAIRFDVATGAMDAQFDEPEPVHTVEWQPRSRDMVYANHADADIHGPYWASRLCGYTD